MSRDWFYVLRHSNMENLEKDINDRYTNGEDMEWLPELPVSRIFARLKKFFPGILGNGENNKDFFWCSDLSSYNSEELIQEYGCIPSSPWPDDEGEGFELSFYKGYMTFCGTGTSDEVAEKMDEILAEFDCLPFCP